MRPRTRSGSRSSMTPGSPSQNSRASSAKSSSSGMRPYGDMGGHAGTPRLAPRRWHRPATAVGRPLVDRRQRMRPDDAEPLRSVIVMSPDVDVARGGTLRGGATEPRRDDRVDARVRLLASGRDRRSRRQQHHRRRATIGFTFTGRVERTRSASSTTAPAWTSSSSRRCGSARRARARPVAVGPRSVRTGAEDRSLLAGAVAHRRLRHDRLGPAPQTGGISTTSNAPAHGRCCWTRCRGASSSSSRSTPPGGHGRRRREARIASSKTRSPTTRSTRTGSSATSADDARPPGDGLPPLPRPTAADHDQRSSCGRWDPFLESHGPRSRCPRSDSLVPHGVVVVRGFVLRTTAKLTHEEFDRAAAEGMERAPGLLRLSRPETPRRRRLARACAFSRRSTTSSHDPG